MQRFWLSWYGGWLCWLLGHRWPPVVIPFHEYPRAHYLGCPRCKRNLER